MNLCFIKFNIYATINVNFRRLIQLLYNVVLDTFNVRRIYKRM